MAEFFSFEMDQFYIERNDIPSYFHLMSINKQIKVERDITLLVQKFIPITDEILTNSIIT